MQAFGQATAVCLSAIAIAPNGAPWAAALRSSADRMRPCAESVTAIQAVVCPWCVLVTVHAMISEIQQRYQAVRARITQAALQASRNPDDVQLLAVSKTFAAEKVREVAATGAIPIVLGGDHSITWPNATAIAELRWPKSIGILHFDAHADTSPDGYGSLHSHGSPMRRLIESGAVQGKNFVQVGLRGYFPDTETLDWMKGHGMRTHLMTEIEERGAEAVIQDAIAEALDGPDAIWISVDIDVVDPGLAPGTGTPEPGGMLTRELLRALRQIAARVPIAGMDILEVSPPYDWAESTAMIANRAALEVISSLAKRKAAGETIRWEPGR